MPERSFGRTVRYRRTKLGLSQAKLAELVGRTTPTIRSWERDKSRPNDPTVLSALAAILGVDERHLFDKAEVERPEAQPSPSVEQALATLSVEDVDYSVDDPEDQETDDVAVSEPTRSAEEPVAEEPPDVWDVPDESEDEQPREDRELVGAANGAPAYVAPPDPYHQTPLTPTVADASYMEDSSQRQLYRVRTLATLVALVALVIAFIWAFGEGLGALNAWWDDFFGDLRL